MFEETSENSGEPTNVKTQGFGKNGGQSVQLFLAV